MSTITVKNAVKKFKNSTVIDNVSLTLEGGNIYGFVGRNGSGKTMLFRAISGLIHLTSGSIEIDGKVLHKDIDALPSVGIAIENAGLFPDLSGYKNLKLLAGIKKKISKDKIRETISEVGLDPDDKRPIRKYSLGMRQRILIAQAIMEGQDILVLDEPFNALDYHTYQDVKSIIRMLKAEGKTIFLTSHHYKDLEQLCDIIYAIENCQLIPITPEIVAHYQEGE